MCDRYLDEFGYQLSSTQQTAAVFAHLEGLHFTTHFYAVEWFTTCFILTLQADICTMIQDMLVYGRHSKKNVLLKIGMAVVSLLSDQLLSLECKSTFVCRVRYHRIKGKLCQQKRSPPLSYIMQSPCLCLYMGFNLILFSWLW